MAGPCVGVHFGGGSKDTAGPKGSHKTSSASVATKIWKAPMQGSEVPGSGGGYCTHKRTHNVPMARKNGEKWGKMGENGGKWGKMGGKWGKMGENKETWVVQLVPFPPISSPFPPHFPPFSPIFPHFPPFFLGSFPHFPPFFLGGFHQCAPPTALLPT